MTGIRIMRVVFTGMRSINTWWVWTARPFIFHPIQTIRDCFTWPEVSDEDLKHLTPEERKALKK